MTISVKRSPSFGANLAREPNSEIRDLAALTSSAFAVARRFDVAVSDFGAAAIFESLVEDAVPPSVP